jgi:hypothetical protein
MTDEAKLTDETIVRKGDVAKVIAGAGYRAHVRNNSLCEVTDTGNGYIVKFPTSSSTEQDYYVCLDYAQAYDMILGLSAFKKELGFV